MEIHAFSGFTQNDNLVRSRTAGVLAGLLETYPEMTWDDVLQWCKENGIPDWVPNIDTDDSQADRLIGGEYAVMFDERYPWTSEAQSNFVSWAKGYDIGKLPPIQTASPAIQQAFTDPVISSQPAPSAPSESIDDWDIFQSQNEDTTLQPVATPATATAYTQAATHPGGGSTPPGGGNPGGGAALNAMQQVSQKPSSSGSSNMLLIVGGIIAAYMLMKRKK